MSCQRCGYCCIMYDVIIILPKYIKEDLDINELPREAFGHKKCYFQCPHLSWKDNQDTFCNIHHYDWFEQTPCYSHNYDKRCRLGEYIKRTKYIIDNVKRFPVQKHFEKGE